MANEVVRINKKIIKWLKNNIGKEFEREFGFEADLKEMVRIALMETISNRTGRVFELKYNPRSKRLIIK